MLCGLFGWLSPAGSLPSQMVTDSPQPAVDMGEIVVIDSVTSMHADLVSVVARAGKPVFIEKPLGCHG